MKMKYIFWWNFWKKNFKKPKKNFFKIFKKNFFSKFSKKNFFSKIFKKKFFSKIFKKNFFSKFSKKLFFQKFSNDFFFSKKKFLWKNISFCKIFENYFSENEIFENWSMAVWIWSFFGELHRLITRICITQMKHLLRLNDSTLQDLWSEIQSEKIWCQT